ncbi:MAG: diguanylate cyclase, partial [Nitrospinae bacterium]|nr:diguanylate cyclase [Nitrospinota bacterium]
QLKRYFGDQASFTGGLRDFIDAVNESYRKLEYEYSLLERAQELNEEELERQMREKELILTSAGEGIFGLDLRGNFTFVNPAAAHILGYANSEIIGKSLDLVLTGGKAGNEPPRDPSPIYGSLRDYISSREADDCFRRKDGSRFPADYTCTSVVEHGAIVGAVVVFTDITERKRAQEKREQLIAELLVMKMRLEEAARTDPLTGLPNRRDFEEKSVYEIKRFERHGKPFGLVIGDIDHFKKINDTYGHDAGDQALKQTARLMQTALRKQDLVFRWGGEEFLILLPETDLKGAETLSEKVRSKFESEDFIYQRQKLPVTMSFGVALYSGDCPNVDHCLKQADNRLYLAKKTGRNKVVSRNDENP